jgi:23S rRNA pseudouridine2605 synthase
MKKPIAKKSEKSPIPSSTTSLSKYIAINGVASRRKATEMIKSGNITVNGRIVYEPGYKVLEKDIVCTQGSMVQPEEKVYILLNKPKDCITTVSDERGRKTVMDLIQLDRPVRLYPVGRLDRSTTGLIVLTNDGDLAQRLAHPRYSRGKIYQVTLDKSVGQGDVKTLERDGIMLEDEHVTIDAIGYVPGERKNVVLIELHSGQHHVVRRIFETLGYLVDKLDRVAYAGLTKQGLRQGQWRHLTKGEVAALKN